MFSARLADHMLNKGVHFEAVSSRGSRGMTSTSIESRFDPSRPITSVLSQIG